MPSAITLLVGLIINLFPSLEFSSVMVNVLGRHVDYCTIQKTDVSMRAPVPVSQVTPDTHSSHDSDSEEGLTTSNVAQFAHSGSYTGAC